MLVLSKLGWPERSKAPDSKRGRSCLDYYGGAPLFKRLRSSRDIWVRGFKSHLRQFSPLFLSQSPLPFEAIINKFLHFLCILDDCGADSSSYLLLLLLRKIVIMMMYSYSKRQIYRFSPIIWEIFSPSSSKISGLTHTMYKHYR